jgi:hypothetical protein
VIALEQEREDLTLRRVYKAIMVAPTLTVCRALLHGERLPYRRLDLAAVNRYGLRNIQCTHCGKAPDRLTLDDINDIPDYVPSRLRKRPEGHLELVANHSQSPSGRTPRLVELRAVSDRQSRES